MHSTTPTSGGRNGGAAGEYIVFCRPVDVECEPVHVGLNVGLGALLHLRLCHRGNTGILKWSQHFGIDNLYHGNNLFHTPDTEYVDVWYRLKQNMNNLNLG